MSTTKTIDEVQIRALMENWAKAVRAMNITDILANHAPDMLLFDVPLPLQSRGIEAYRKSWEELFFPWFQGSGVFDISELSMTTGNDVAFSHCLIRCGRTEQSGKKVEIEVRLTVCYRKIDGKWMIVHEHHSVPASA